jgi:hypothetical protein
MEFPITLGFGSAKLDLKTAGAAANTVGDFARLVTSPSFNRLVFERVNDEAANFYPSAQVPNVIKFTLRLKLETIIPQEVRELIYLVVKATERRQEWQKQADDLLLHRANFEELRTLPSQAVEYFRRCPIAPLEYEILDSAKALAYIERDKELLRFAQMKWKVIPASLRKKITAVWKREQGKDAGIGNSARRNTDAFVRPDFFYHPDFRVFVGNEQHDFSHRHEVQRHARLLRSHEVRKWFDYLHRTTGYWIFASPEEPEHALGMLLSHGLLCERAIQQARRIFREPVSMKLGVRNAAALIYFACQDDRVQSLWEVFSPDRSVTFDENYLVDDSKWFEMWASARTEILNRLSLIGMTRTQESRLYLILDRLYDHWVEAGKPKLSTYNMMETVRQTMRLIADHSRDAGVSALYPTEQDPSDLEFDTVSKFNEFLNELDWGF